jgi:hypothetical protein
MNTMPCVNCTKPFTPTRFWHKFCSEQCRIEGNYKKLASMNTFYKLPKTTIGVVSEFRVCCDLLSKGFDVFRSLNPASKCDLAIRKGKVCLRIEVRTAHRTSAGKVYKNRQRKKVDDQDVFAFVLPEEIIYEPTIEEALSKVSV